MPAIKAPKNFNANSSTISLTAALVLAAAAAGDEKKLRKFAMQAYNGGPMQFWWSDDPVVVDLAGLDLSAQSRPIFYDHSRREIVGHTQQITINAGKTVSLSGVVSGAGQAAKEVVEAADNGFPWQASIGTTIDRAERVAAGQQVTVNGQTFQGPILVVRASRLQEVSFVALGADDSTKARMIAGRDLNNRPQEKLMDFAAWLMAKGFDPSGLSETQKASLQAAYDAEHKAPVKGEPTELHEENVELNALKASRVKAAEETRRIDGIREKCGGKHGKIEAQAIEEGWTIDKTELTVLRAARPTAPSIHGSKDEGMSQDVLEAAVMQNARMPEAKIIKAYSQKTLEAADKRFKGRISLNELLLEAAYANGFTGRTLKVTNEALRHAFALQAGGFSTVDISGILSNVANKSILEGFSAVEQTWRKISAISPVNDFKTVTRYRMTGDDVYEKVGPAGEIKHGDLDEESFTNKADTYAKMLAITRQDLINDDLGALTQLPKKLGRGAAIKLNRVLWTEFQDDSSFFTSGNANYFDGSGSTLQISQLAIAVGMFLDQEDADGNPLSLTPRILLVPTALAITADLLVRSAEIRDNTASTKTPTLNPFAGKFDVGVSAYLTSTTGWYLLADPQDMPIIETVFLNGQEAPTIENAMADFNTLGIQLRGYHDFGVAKQDARAGVKSKGAAA